MKYTDQINRWTGDRRKIGLDAIEDMDTDGVNILTICEDNELLGIATVTADGELLNLATKRSGYGIKMMELIAQFALDRSIAIWGTSSDDALGFYGRLGFEIEGYPGENNGVPIAWFKSQIERFMSDDRAAMMAQAREEYQEYLDYIEEAEAVMVAEGREEYQEY